MTLGNQMLDSKCFGILVFVVLMTVLTRCESKYPNRPAPVEPELILPFQFATVPERPPSWVANQWNFPKGYDKSPIPIDRESLEALETSTYFDIERFILDEELVSALRNAQQLRWLHVGRRASAANLDKLCELNLRGLSLCGADLRDADFSALERMEDLRYLNLRSCTIDADQRATFNGNGRRADRVTGSSSTKPTQVKCTNCPCSTRELKLP